jgi:hypothetical protein
MVVIYPHSFSRHGDDPLVAVSAIKSTLHEYASTLSTERGTNLTRMIQAIFEDGHDQDMGQRLLNHILGFENSKIDLLDSLAKADRFHLVSAGYAHDAFIAAKLGYSNPWALIAHSMYWLGMAEKDEAYDDVVSSIRASDARHKANLLHDKPGGSREKRKQIQEIWASGKYSSRDMCAEQECAALNMSISTARKALVNTPDPVRPLPAKGIRRQ